MLPPLLIEYHDHGRHPALRSQGCQMHVAVSVPGREGLRQAEAPPQMPVHAQRDFCQCLPFDLEDENQWGTVIVGIRPNRPGVRMSGGERSRIIHEYTWLGVTDQSG